nr:EOG090X05XL [Ceriodaphnia reticulata]
MNLCGLRAAKTYFLHDDDDIKFRSVERRNYPMSFYIQYFLFVFTVKDKYGESSAIKMIAEGDVDSSSTSESEDEDGEAWDSEVEKQFFQTLASLKKKDPSIYNAEKKFFDKNLQPTLPKNDDEDILILKLKRFLRFVQKVMLSGLLQEKEEEEYKEWLKGRKEDISNEETKKQLEPLKQYWSDPKLDENEAFLKDFFLNKRYKCSEDKEYIPTYDEVVHDSEGDLSEDEKTLEQQMEFEHKYNFRFEEPDAEFIKRYPRTIADSLRRPDTSRKQKRDEVKERKKREKEEKKEDLKMLKKYKLKEIQEKLEQLKTITGNESLPFQDDDLEGDFDPDKYDRKMGEIFNHDYYHVGNEDQKPEFPYDPDIDDENWDDYTGQEAGPSTSSGNYDDVNGYDGPHCEDPDFNMDCDYVDNKEEVRKEMVDMTLRNRGRKKSIFAQKLETKKPVFDPQQYPNYEEYLEEYYKLDYEDIIGDQPVRFKYRTVVPNDFGLDTEEILVARDKELNQWCSVKKMSQYRTEQEEKQDFYTYITKKRNISLKKRVLPSIFVENSEELMVADQEKDRKKRRRNQGKEEDPESQTVENTSNHQNTPEAEEMPKKKKRKNKGKPMLMAQEQSLQDFGSTNFEKTDEVSHKRKKDKAEEIQEIQVEQEQPKSKKAKVDKPLTLVENETCETAQPIQNQNKSDKKRKKNKKRLSGISEKTIVTDSDSPTIKQAIKQSTKKPEENLMAKNDTRESNPSVDNTPKKKSKKKKKPVANSSPTKNEAQETNPPGNNAPKKKKKKKNQNKSSAGTKIVTPAKKINKKSTTVRGLDISDDRLKAYGIRNPKKFKNAMIYGNLTKS